MRSDFALSGSIYDRFLQDVVNVYAMSSAERELVTEPRSGRTDPLPEDTSREIAAGRRIDLRIPYLMRLSGKGGFVANEEDFRKTREPFANVSLLDHTLSVTRGAIVLAEGDLTAGGFKPAQIEPRLARIAAVAFLHDADKILQISRREPLTVEVTAALMCRFGIDAFLQSFGLIIAPTKMLSMIDGVETSRDGILGEGRVLLSPDEVRDCGYVRLADVLDGTFLDARKNLDDLVEILMSTPQLRSGAFKVGWKTVTIRSPHTPFLMDALHAAISERCREAHGHPPLFEVHHDGVLTVLLPEAGCDTVLRRAIGDVAKIFGGKMRVTNSTRGGRDLVDARGGASELFDSISEMPAAEIEKTLRVQRKFVEDNALPISELFSRFGVGTSFPDLTKNQAQLLPAWTNISSDETLRAFATKSATVAAALACDDSRAVQHVRRSEREADLIAFMRDRGVEVPALLTESADDVGRFTLLAALSVAVTEDDPEEQHALLGSGGVVDRWLLGNGERPGLSEKIEDAAGQLGGAVDSYFGALVAGRFVDVSDPNAEGRCHFTNATTPRDARIDGKTGLYGLNVSAFSGREGRPEYFDRAEAETLVSPIAQAEHRFREMISTGGRKPTVPVFVSSSTTSGLFAALTLSRETLDVSTFDVMRATRTPDKLVVEAIDPLRRRLVVGRYEEMPTRFESSKTASGQVDFIRRTMETALRIGRPIHVFRGLPTEERAFVFFDFLPPALEQMLGGRAFRLEQLPNLIRLTRLIADIAASPLFGAELAQAVADPKTRFGAACQVYSRLKRAEEGGDRVDFMSRSTLFQLLETTMSRNEGDTAILRFAEAMAGVQRAKISSDGGGVLEIGLRLALEAADASARIGQTAPDSVVAAVAGLLKENLERRDLLASKVNRDGASVTEAVEKAARIFVEDVWFGAFKGNSPSAKHRRTAMAIYRFGFETKARKPATN